MTTSSPPGVIIRPSVAEDAEAIQTLIEGFVERQLLLERTIDELRGLTRFGFIAEDQGQVVGFCAVEIYSRKLAEIQCLAVADSHQGKGIGRRLVQGCIRLAKAHNILELMAISSSDAFLKECGFDYSLPNQKRALFMHPASLEDEE
ncbi:MAG: GNAT family N-acetyltransferase [Pirellulaceae bacterium]